MLGFHLFYTINNLKREDKKHENPLLFREKPSQPGLNHWHTDTAMLDWEGQKTTMPAQTVFHGILKFAH